MPKKTNESLAKPEQANGEKVELSADFGKVYVRVRGDQILRPIKATMTVYEKLGHFYKLRNDYPLIYEGYKHLNKVASINLLTPPKVTGDGREQPNPYIERNEKTKMIESVYIRKIGIGYSPAGNLTAIDKTLFYNVFTYFIQSIQAKMKKKVWKSGKPTDELMCPDCAEIGIEREKPKKDGKWLFLETAPPLGIWINYNDPAIVDCIDEHIQRQKFGDRIAQTIVERNILKDHPAIGISKVLAKDSKEKGRYANVTVYGYRHEFEYPDIKNLLSQADSGSEVIDIKAETIEEVPYEEEAEVVKDTAKEEKSPAEMDEPPEEYHLKQQEREADVEGEK